jgi:hypothetical protein
MGENSGGAEISADRGPAVLERLPRRRRLRRTARLVEILDIIARKAVAAVVIGALCPPQEVDRVAAVVNAVVDPTTEDTADSRNARCEALRF